MGSRLGPRKAGALSIAVALVLGAGVLGCGGDDEPSNGSAAASEESGGTKKVELLPSFPYSIYWTPLVVANELGYYDDEGLDVTFKETDGSGFVTQQLISRNSDFGRASATNEIIAFEKDPKLRLAGCASPKNIYSIVVKEGSPITSVEQLEGKTLGITEPGGGEEAVVNAALGDAGLKANQDVKLLPVGEAGPQSQQAIDKGQVDAYASSYPDIAALTAAGLTFADITPEKYNAVPGGCVITHEDALADPDKRDTAIKLMRAEAKGALFAETNPDAAFELICKAIPAECEDEAFAREYMKSALDRSGFSVIEPWGVVPAEAWDTVVTLLKDSDALEGDDLDPAPLYSELEPLSQEYLDFDQEAVRKQAEEHEAGS